MVKAAMSSVLSRESMIPGEGQILSSPLHNDAQVEEIKRNYSTQNRLLARKNEELQLRVTNLEKQLFHTQKQVLGLKNEKIQLNDRLNLNSKRFNNIIVDSLDRLMSEYRSFMTDVGVDIEKKDVPSYLGQKVLEETRNPLLDFEHYWKNINDDLQRRKSSIFTPRNRSSEIDIVTSDTLIEGDNETDNAIESETNQLDTLVEKEEDVPSEPDYQDENSTLIPMKRQSIMMEKIDNVQMSNIPFLGLDKTTDVAEHEEENTGDNKEFNIEMFDNENDELFNCMGDEHTSPVNNDHDEPVEKNEQRFTGKSSLDELDNESLSVINKKKSRKTRVPRELKNLDTEKTKKWLGMDPLDDVEESTSERRKSRRRSLVVNYQLPSLKRKMRRKAENPPYTVYVEEDKENRIRKPKNNTNRGVLRNITNISSMNNFNGKNNFLNDVKGGHKEDKDRSIFDLENMDVFEDYRKSQKLFGERSSSRENMYDLLL